MVGVEVTFGVAGGLVRVPKALGERAKFEIGEECLGLHRSAERLRDRRKSHPMGSR